MSAGPAYESGMGWEAEVALAEGGQADFKHGYPGTACIPGGVAADWGEVNGV